MPVDVVPPNEAIFVDVNAARPIPFEEVPYTPAGLVSTKGKPAPLRAKIAAPPPVVEFVWPAVALSFVTLKPLLTLATLVLLKSPVIPKPVVAAATTVPLPEVEALTTLLLLGVASEKSPARPPKLEPDTAGPVPKVKPATPAPPVLLTPKTPTLELLVPNKPTPLSLSNEPPFFATTLIPLLPAIPCTPAAVVPTVTVVPVMASASLAVFVF